MQEDSEVLLDLAPATDEETERFLAWLFGPTQGDDEGMTHNEANALLEYIRLGRKSDVACVRELGNGEHVVVIKKRSWHCWCPADWARFQALESKEKEVNV